MAGLSTTELLFFDRLKLWFGHVESDLWIISFVAIATRQRRAIPVYPFWEGHQFPDLRAELVLD